MAYSVLDDYGLPSTPFEVSVFAASIGKRWDHGIAMESGIIQPKGEKLDPVRHFDLSRCTMVMQSQGMNWGKHVALEARQPLASPVALGYSTTSPSTNTQRRRKQTAKGFQPCGKPQLHETLAFSSCANKYSATESLVTILANRKPCDNTRQWKTL